MSRPEVFSFGMRGAPEDIGAAQPCAAVSSVPSSQFPGECRRFLASLQGGVCGGGGPQVTPSGCYAKAEG